MFTKRITCQDSHAIVIKLRCYVILRVLVFLCKNCKEVHLFCFLVVFFHKCHLCAATFQFMSLNYQLNSLKRNVPLQVFDCFNGTLIKKNPLLELNGYLCLTLFFILFIYGMFRRVVIKPVLLGLESRWVCWHLLSPAVP